MSKHHSFLIYLSIILIFFSANIGLDYVLTTSNSLIYSIKFGQYLFFICTLIAGSLLIYSPSFDLKEFFQIHYSIYIILFFIFFSNIISNSFWNWRILAIVTLISIVSIMAGYQCTKLPKSKQLNVLVLIFIPFFFPVVASLFLEIAGPIDFGVVIENSKHFQYEPPRWYFLNSSANGLGLDGAFASLIAYGMLHYHKTISKFIWLLLLLLSIFVLVKTGTRAAMVFCLVGILWLSMIFLSFKFFAATMGVAIVLCLAYINLFGLEFIIEFFRLDGNLAQISSKRWVGIKKMIPLIKESILIGRGFGEADNNFPVDPSNLFYFSIFVELGVVGLISLFAFIFLPIGAAATLIYAKHSKKNSFPCFTIGSAVLVSFIPYLVFEFNVFRVSAYNQVYFFFWGVVTYICLSKMPWPRFSKQSSSQK